jgi:diguanylate cyclase (GGDEF)-like protein/PAS domain S-box-containing protein
VPNLKKIPTLWRFLLPVLLLLAIATSILMWRQTTQHLKTVEHGALSHAQSLRHLLLATDTLITQQVDAAMKLLQQRSLATGSPQLDGSFQLNQMELPQLKFGSTRIGNNTVLVDDISSLFGGTTTIFVRNGDNFYRISTNVRYQDGSRAIGSQLAPDGKVIETILQGRAFRGMVQILGHPYLSRYEPIIDTSGKIIGIWYVGYRIDMQAIREAIQSSRYLNSGFAVIVDENQHAIFSSRHAPIEIIDQFLQSPPADWKVVEEKLENWNFRIVVAYPLSEAYTAGWANSILIISEATLLGILLLAVILWQLRRLVLEPIGADPALAIEVVQKIADGNLEQDRLTAKSGSLMASVLTMREKLKKTLQTLQKNADDMQLSASVFEHTNDGIFITDADAYIVEVNPAFNRISGFSREEAIGKTTAELHFACDEPQLFEQLRRGESGSEWKGESRNLRKTGDAYVASLDLFAVHDAQGRISHFVGVFSDITAEMLHRESLEHMAYHDPLTQLPNRTLLADRLQLALAHAQRMDEIVAVCYFDLDDFKLVNDQHGHSVGDNLLVQFASRMRGAMRETDTIARMGGDEFALLICGLKSHEECQQALNRLLLTINLPFHIGDITASVSASIGYTIFPDDNSTADTLLRHADQAMYQAKLNGGRCFHLFDAEHDRYTRGQRQQRERIIQALQADEFTLYYQPQVDMKRGKVIGMEALIRWLQPESGTRLPSEFLPQIEHTDFIIELGEWVIVTALRQLHDWQHHGLSMPISVNIAARHLMQSKFADRLADLLDAFPDVSPQLLQLEITETAAIEDISGVTQTIQRCKQLGVSFALDDFGVGYSSLTYLRRLPIDVIKIDQSFVRDMLDDNDDRAVIAGIISLSREFEREVVAEGLETAEHGVHLLRMGCHVAQGFGISQAMPASEIPQWLLNYRPDMAWHLAGQDVLLPRS